MITHSDAIMIASQYTLLIRLLCNITKLQFDLPRLIFTNSRVSHNKLIRILIVWFLFPIVSVGDYFNISNLRFLSSDISFISWQVYLRVQSPPNFQELSRITYVNFLRCAKTDRLFSQRLLAVAHFHIFDQQFHNIIFACQQNLATAIYRKFTLASSSHNFEKSNR